MLLQESNVADEKEESKMEELKRQNSQLIDDVNMLLQQNVELKSLLQAY